MSYRLLDVRPNTSGCRSPHHLWELSFQLKLTHNSPSCRVRVPNAAIHAKSFLEFYLIRCKTGWHGDLKWQEWESHVVTDRWWIHCIGTILANYVIRHLLQFDALTVQGSKYLALLSFLYTESCLGSSPVGYPPSKQLHSTVSRRT